jgi:uncharacterized protein YrzB (UPF0473 family)
MIFKQIYFNSGEVDIKVSPIVKFNDEENKKLGYVLHDRHEKSYDKRYFDEFYIVFAAESDGTEGDEEYKIITTEEAKKILKEHINEHMKIDRKKLQDYYMNMIMALDD